MSNCDCINARKYLLLREGVDTALKIASERSAESLKYTGKTPTERMVQVLELTLNRLNKEV